MHNTENHVKLTVAEHRFSLDMNIVQWPRFGASGDLKKA